LLIGTSNTEGIDEQKLSSSVNVTKVTAYTLDETHNVIDNTQVKPDVVITHALANYVVFFVFVFIFISLLFS
jgi:hypothetical protein